ncbi:ester cyclase [Chloroflexota bacterium]
MARYTMTATHTGEFLGVPPTGKKIELKVAYCYRFKNSKEVEAIPYSDMLAFYQQIGVTHPMG